MVRGMVRLRARQKLKEINSGKLRLREKEKGLQPRW